jgi:hypothetical protein
MLKYRLHELYAQMRTQSKKGLIEIKNDYMMPRDKRNRLENALIDGTISMTEEQLFWAAQYFGVTVEEVYQPEYLAKLKRASLDLV